MSDLASTFVVSLVSGFFFIFLGTLGIFIIRARWLRGRFEAQNKRFSVAFFHPYCMSGGGGERVLWAALKSLCGRYPAVHFVIYTGDSPESCSSYRAHVFDRFKIDIPKQIHLEFVHLKSRWLLEAQYYPFLTMFGQSLGSIVVALESLWNFSPHFFIDTTGCAFTFPVFRFLSGSQIAAYVHYPTISTDMLSLVEKRKASYNNAGLVSRSPTLSTLKLYYYKLFAFLYGLAGKCCDVVMVNSTWTLNHIREIWRAEYAVIVYPPCNVAEFLKIPRMADESQEFISIVSIGQFRPEKNHELQIRMLQPLLKMLRPELARKVRLDFVGSCRNEGDERRVESLRNLAKELGLENVVNFHLNVPFPTLLDVCRKGTIAIHTMWNEHFGIGVVEGMAAGLLTVAHNSAGPKMDIVTDVDGGASGKLAETEDEYAVAIKHFIELPGDERNLIRKGARLSVERFSDENFDRNFARSVESVMCLSKEYK